MKGHKLTEEQVSAIRLARKRGKTFRELAERYGLSHSTVWSIVNQRTWITVAPATCPHCHEVL